MELLVCILKDYRLIQNLLLGFVEHGVTGATVLEGRGMGQILGSELPIFADLRGLFPGSAVESHVVLAVIRQGRSEVCLDLVERLAGPFDQPGSGIVFTVPLNRVIGLMPEIG